MTESAQLPKKKTFFRQAAIAGGLLFTLAIGGVFVVYAVKNARQTQRYQTALAAYDRGDYAEAEIRLLNYLKEDRNQENAWVKLAELYGKQQRWRSAARCWRFAASLNSLNESYARAHVEALLRTRSFRAAAEAVGRLPEAQQQPFRPALCLAWLMGGQLEKAKSLLATLPGDPGDVRLRWLHFLADHAAQWTAGKRQAQLPQLAVFARSSDEVVAVEALMQLFQAAMDGKKMAEAESWLQRLAEINPEYALPLLGDFYYQARRYEDAYRAYQKATRDGLPQDAVFRYADVLFFLNKPVELKQLAPVFQTGKREAMLCGFYIEALVAYLEQNVEALGKNLKQLDASVTSPLAVVMKFDYALRSAQVPLLVAVFQEITRRRELADFSPTAYEKVQSLLAKLYAERKIAEAAPLVRFLYPGHRDNLRLARMFFLDQGMTETVAPEELDSALQKFPDDPVLLTVAVDDRLRKGEFQAALPLAERNLAAGNASVYAAVQEVMALDGGGRGDAARKKYEQLRNQHPDNAEILKSYLAFCLRRNRPLPELGSAPQFQALQRLLAGERAFRDQQTARMIEDFSAPALLQALDPAKPEDQALLYHMALRLGGADALKPAIAIYEKLKPVVAEPLLIQLNLAELHAAAGEKEAALREARAAWLSRGAVPAAQACYGLRLAESGDDGKALAQLGPLVAGKSDDPRIFPAWVKVLESLIAKSYQAGRYGECLDYCGQLRRGAPDNAVARDYGGKAQAAMARAKGR